MRVVTAHADEEKSGMLSRLSLELAAQWWVREVQPAGQARPAGQVGGAGSSGSSAPPRRSMIPAARSCTSITWTTTPT